MNKTLISLLIVLTLPLADAVAQTGGAKGVESFPADSPEIRYGGRTKTEADGSVSYDWSGVYFEFDFTGGYCAVKASDSGKNRFNLFIDGTQSGVVKFAPDTTVVLFDAAGLYDTDSCSGQRHTIRLQKRTEGSQGIFTLKKVLLAEDGALIPTELPSEKRRILFIGNSLTCGYGVESASNKEHFSNLTENCDKAFGCVTARYFDADYVLISHSGIGAARNYGYNKKVSEYTMREEFGQTFDGRKDEKWNFENDDFRPDIVVIYLGTNDFSTKPWPDYRQFSSAYLDIVGQVRKAYGNVPVLCVSTYIIDPALEYIRRIVDEGNGSKSELLHNLHFACIMPEYSNSETERGADDHPNAIGQIKTAMLLIPYISTITGWPVQPEP
ncbi:MAG: GDSL-type esterase/lipase family protein [Bacteroidales bacterium]|jgi:lysophospholipase L1-like esterase|nr:GDSL-type esterase/lipase family protein [Bacteroidales bacterium]MCI2122089.1 GDSL-type esterase/lipase family protein [Bacteroidales bacterium]MCI2145770.1 GDSL-type esterase/lipase family protein [Bacteroidales bacterium]